VPRRILAGILGLALWCCAAGAQDWPARTVTVYVPFIAGSTPDSLARIVAERLMPEHVL